MEVSVLPEKKPVRLISPERKPVGVIFLTAGLILFLLVVYYPIFGIYAHTDSYEFFWNARRNPIFDHVFIQGGRPIFGFFVTKLFRWADTIADLRYIRLIAFVGNAALLIGFHYFLVREKFSLGFAAAMTLFFSCSAVICLAMSWTAAFQIGWAMLFALMSAMCCLRVTGAEANNSQRILNLGGAVAGGLISLMLYQPSFTFFILVIFLAFERRKATSQFIRATFVYLLIFVIYFIIFKTILWYTGLPPLSRSGLDTNIFGKIYWFLDNALVHSLKFNLHVVRNSVVNIFRVPVVILFLFCIVRFFLERKINRESIGYALMVICTYFLAYLPNLASTEYHASNRSLGTVVLLNAYFFFRALEYVIQSPRIRQIAFVGASIVFCVFGYTNLRYGVTKIQSTEYAILKKATLSILEGDSKHAIDTIHIIRPTRQFLQEQGVVQRETGGEIGLLSNSVDWATLPMFLAFIDEIAPITGHDPSAITLNICSPLDKDRCTGKGPVIDVGQEFLMHYQEYY